MSGSVSGSVRGSVSEPVTGCYFGNPCVGSGPRKSRRAGASWRRQI